MGKRNKHMQQQQQHQQHNQHHGDSNGTIIRQLKEIPGVMSCVFAHRTSSSTSEFSWTGGTLNEIWPEILAFFRWTNQEYKSESQVRLFVNIQTKQWKAWAFPQKARLGMSAKELADGDEGYERTRLQRAEFPDETWYYWGTVHHHCDAGAFQSGTDTQNEHDQDGIHITVGSLGSPRYTIDFRIYVGKFRLTSITVDKFWDCGEIEAGLPAHIKALLPADAREKLAKYQMCEPPPADQTFPEIWKENIIDCRPPTPPVSQPVNGPSTTGGQSTLELGSNAVRTHVRPYSARSKANYEWDLKKATTELIQLIRHPAFSTNDLEVVYDCLVTMSNVLDDESLDVLDILARNDVTPYNMAKFLDKFLKDEKQKELEADIARQDVEGGNQRKTVAVGHEPPPQVRPTVVPMPRPPATTAQVLGTTTVHGVKTPELNNTPPHWTDEMNNGC